MLSLKWLLCVTGNVEYSAPLLRPSAALLFMADLQKIAQASFSENEDGAIRNIVSNLSPIDHPSRLHFGFGLCILVGFVFCVHFDNNGSIEYMNMHRKMYMFAPL